MGIPSRGSGDLDPLDARGRRVAVLLGDEGRELVVAGDELLGWEGQRPPEGVRAVRLLLGQDRSQSRRRRIVVDAQSPATARHLSSRRTRAATAHLVHALRASPAGPPRLHPPRRALVGPALRSIVDVAEASMAVPSTTTS